MAPALNTYCQEKCNFSSKCTSNYFGGRAPPRPDVELKCSQNPLAGFNEWALVCGRRKMESEGDRNWEAEGEREKKVGRGEGEMEEKFH